MITAPAANAAGAVFCCRHTRAMRTIEWSAGLPPKGAAVAGKECVWQMELPLSALRRGQWAYIQQVEGHTDMGRRLAELGLLPGTRVACELVSPAGDPAAYRVRGTLIALRRGDADRVRVAPAGEGAE